MIYRGIKKNWLLLRLTKRTPKSNTILQDEIFFGSTAMTSHMKLTKPRHISTNVNH